jgi:pimeloyl-ACP methyl ester carboxylesterase
MGGLLTARLLGLIPERLLSAGFGGSGVQEVDEEQRALVPKDPEGVDPVEAETSRNLRISFAMNNGKTREEAEAIADRPAARQPITPEQAERMRAMMGAIDLTKVEIPVLAINGEYDRPYSNTHRLWRELRDFTNVVLPGKSHLTAIVAGSMPPEYLEATVRFIDSHDA